MTRIRPLLIGALALLLLAPGRATGQMSLSATCAPGIPGCEALRFFIGAIGSDLSLNTLRLHFLSAGWAFLTGPEGSSGSYSAEDSWGPFSGFTSISADRQTVDIDFTENGFPFEVFADETGFVDLGVERGANARDLFFSFHATTSDGTVLEGNVVPEPVSMVLLGTGLAGVAVMRRRRRRGPDSEA